MDVEQLGAKVVERLPDKMVRLLERPAARKHFSSLREKERTAVRGRHLNRKAGTLVLAAGAGMLLVLASMVKYQAPLEVSGVLERPSYGEGSDRALLEYVWSEDREEAAGSMVVAIPEQMPDDEEAARVLGELEDDLLTSMLGNNENVDNITESLKFSPLPFTNANIRVSYASSEPYLVSEYGSVRNQDLAEPAQVVVETVMSYGGASRKTVFELVVMPKVMEPWEREAWLKERIEEDGQSVYLPTEGGSVAWILPENGMQPYKVLMAAVLASVLASMLVDYELAKDVKSRREAMVKDLPGMMQRLALLMHAGATLPQAWKRLCDDYEKVKSGAFTRPLYEEALSVMASYETGVPFATCLFDMNRYCGQMEVSRMTLLLIQNIKKGNKMLLQSIDQMNRELWKTHLELMKKQGELVSTKMLLPMLVQLAVVLAIVLAPALMSLKI